MGGSKLRPRRRDGRFHLRHGPYHSPRARIGSRLFCENLGSVRVVKFSDGLIPWPKGHVVGERGGTAFVLRGDLVRAVRLEAAEAVARAWGVHPTTVSRWRRILGGDQYNPGTHDLFLAYQGKGLTAEATARGRASQTPKKQIEWAAVRREEGRTRKRLWTPKEDALLGTMPDPDLARRIGCSDRTVKLRRLEVGIGPFIVSPAAAASVKATAARLLPFSTEKLRARRLKLGLFQTQAAARCGWKTAAMYQRLESGLQRRATPQVLDRLARALECRVKDLLESA